MKRIVFIVIFLLGCGSVRATGTITVKYLSAENVYLNAGEADGLWVGARLVLPGKNGPRAEIEIVYVAAHSASCEFVSGAGLIKVGDQVKLKSAPPAADTAETTDTVVVSAPKTEIIAAPSPPQTKPKTIRQPLTGSIAFDFYHWNDQSIANLDFTQATTRLTLKARRLWGKQITLAIRGRGRFDQRQRDYSTGVGRNEWQNRLWEFSLSYEEPSSPVHFYAGRILPRMTGSIGYLDGLLVDGSLTPRLRAGVFVGSYPGWMYDNRRLALTKTGGYLSYRKGEYTTQFFEQNIGIVGEYHNADVSREYLALQGRFTKGNVWGFSNTGEIDINRSWRKERSGKTIELTNMYLTSWYRPVSGVRLSLSYDNRTNYWTYDNRTVADSLFDDNLRQGIRLQTDLSLPARIYSSMSLGYRNRAGDPNSSKSYSVRLQRGNVFVRGLSLSTQYAAFDNSTNRGYNYTLRAGGYIRTRYNLDVAYGRYAYRDFTGIKNQNSWVELYSRADFSRRYWLGLRIQMNSGDDIKGYQLQTEFGHRF
jgi:hypothetical protein